MTDRRVTHTTQHDTTHVIQVIHMTPNASGRGRRTVDNSASREWEVLTIKPVDYWAGRHRDVADRIMSEVGYTPECVTEIRVSEGRTEVDWLWLDDDGTPRLEAGEVVNRTTVITPNERRWRDK